MIMKALLMLACVIAIAFMFHGNNREARIMKSCMRNNITSQNPIFSRTDPKAYCGCLAQRIKGIRPEPDDIRICMEQAVQPAVMEYCEAEINQKTLKESGFAVACDCLFDKLADQASMLAERGITRLTDDQRQEEGMRIMSACQRITGLQSLQRAR